MENNIYAVIDTNVIVSALISKSLESNPLKVFRIMMKSWMNTGQSFQGRSSVWTKT